MGNCDILFCEFEESIYQYQFYLDNKLIIADECDSLFGGVSKCTYQDVIYYDVSYSKTLIDIRIYKGLNICGILSLFVLLLILLYLFKESFIK